MSVSIPLIEVKSCKTEIQYPRQGVVSWVVFGISWAALLAWGTLIFLRPEWLWMLYFDWVIPTIAFIEMVFLFQLLKNKKPTRVLLFSWVPTLFLFVHSISLGFAWSGERNPQTVILPSQKGKVKVACLGDFGRGSEASYKIGTLVAKTVHPSFDAVFLLGDNIYGDQQFDDALRDRIQFPLALVIDQKTPVFSILGSHDIKGGYESNELDTPILGMCGKRYYELKTEDDLVSFFMIDSERFAYDPVQYRWLEKAVRKSSSRWKILVTHGPPEASDVAHGYEQDLRRMIAPLLNEGQFQLVLSAKNHLYERRTGTMSDLTFVTIGSSGRVDNREFPYDQLRESGYIRDEAYVSLDVNQHSLSMKAIKTDGTIIDQYTIDHPGNH